MNEVLTPDGWGQVLRTQSAHGRTSYLVKGAGFEGWYDGLEVTADFADQPDDVVPNDDNSTALPYPSAPQGPGWDGTTSTIQPNIDPHLEMGHASDSLTGDSTDEDPVGADLDSNFEPHSRLSNMRAHRLHFATSDDQILDVSTIPDDSPVGLDNSPINPDGVSTDDLFNGESFTERTSSYDRLVIEDDLSFLRYAADDDGDSDDKKKDRHQQDNYGPFNTDRDDDDDDSDDDSDDDDSDSDDDGDSDGDSDSDGDGGDGGGSGGHTASAFRVALTTTADLHFLANLCVCAEELPLHSKSEHRELLAEGGLKHKHADGNTNGVDAQPRDLDEAHERYQQDQHFQPAPLDLVDHSLDDEDNADLYNHYASTQRTAEEDGYDKYIGSNGDGTYHLIASGGGKLPKGKQYGHYDSYQDAHDAVEAIIARNHSRRSSKVANEGPQGTFGPGDRAPGQSVEDWANEGIEHQDPEGTDYWKHYNDGYNAYRNWYDNGHDRLAQHDTDYPQSPLEMADLQGKPSGFYDGYEDENRGEWGMWPHARSLGKEPGSLTDEEAAANPFKRMAKTAGESGVHAPYKIVKRNGRWHVVNAKGESKEAKGYSTEEEARQHQKALYANVPGAAEMAKHAAPAQPPQPTQIESQIEQLMQFWAVDNNGWWHWTGSQSDLALLNQMQQQMMAVGMPQGQPGAMQAQSKTAAPVALLGELGAGEAAAGAGAAEGSAAEGAMSQMPLSGGGTPSPTSMVSGLAEGIGGMLGGKGVAHHNIPFQAWSFAVEPETPKKWAEYLHVVASDKLVALAAWADVVQKSKRLRAEGAVDVEVFKPEVITAYVQGDHGRYYTTVQRLGSVGPGVGRQLTSTQVSGWSCECEWGHWAWLRKRSFVGRMCSHAYALFSEMRSLDAKARRPDKGKPGRFASTKTAWTRDGEQFVWVTPDLAAPTASIAKTASGWNAQVWSDGTAEDSLDLGDFKHSKYAMRAVARTINAAEGDVEMAGDDNVDDYEPEPLPGEGDDNQYDEGPGPGIQESKTSSFFSVFADTKSGDDDEGPEEEDSGIEEEDPEDDEESLDEEIARDEDGEEDDGQDNSGDEDESDEADDENDDGGHYEEHKRDDEGTDNPGDESDDDHVEKQSRFRRRAEVHAPDLTMEDGPHHDNEVPCDNCGHVGGDHDSEEPHGKCLHPGCKCPGWDDENHPDTDPGDMEKQSSVAELQRQYGLSHLAGANYSLAQQAALVSEGEGKTARNHGDLDISKTHYEASASEADPEDTLAFLF